MTLTYGELFAGYGGLGMGVQSVLGGEMAWCAEFDPAPSKILAHHWPDVPNLGDVTKVDWHSVPKVDVITGGSPCQDLSHAGKRKGMTDGTRSNLWVEMREAIAVIRPRLVVWENVRGALSANASSDLEPCAGCVGDRDDRPVLRALGRVLGDLSELRYDCRWYGLRAADVGAAHGRFRVFIFATPRDAEPWTWGAQPGERPTAGEASRSGPTDQSGGSGVPPLTLLPTPAVNDMGAGKTPDAWDAWDAWTERMRAAHGNGNGHGKSLAIEAMRLLPTPEAKLSESGPDYARAGRSGSGGDDLITTLAKLLPTPRATDGTKGGPNQRGSSGDLMLPSAVQDWRDYADAIHRQENAFGRLAPAPTEPGAKGQPRLSPRFVEWLMAVPEGHVTDVPDITRNDQLKALGNGVVIPQAAAATRAFLRDNVRRAVA